MSVRAVATAVSIVTVGALAAAVPARAQAPSAIPLATSPVRPAPAAPASTPKPTKTVKAVSKSGPEPDGEADLAYGAYQRGYYLTAFAEATKRVNASADPRAM